MAKLDKDAILKELWEKAKPLSVDDARMIFLNFSGHESEYNKAGDRNFGIRLDSEDLVNKALKYGYNVKYRQEGDESIPWIKVKVKYGKKPPHIYMKSRGKVTEITEDTVSLVDDADILKANCIISPYPYVMPTGQYGIAAYLKTLYLTVIEDKFAADFFGDDEEDDDEMIPFD